MMLAAHSDTSYLSYKKQEAEQVKNFMSDDTAIPSNNGAVITIS